MSDINPQRTAQMMAYLMGHDQPAQPQPVPDGGESREHVISLDGPVPTEPGWYFCQWPYVSDDKPFAVLVRRIDGKLRAQSGVTWWRAEREFPNARWSHRIRIGDQP